MGLTYDALFPGRFVKAGEFNGKDVTLTIKAVYLDELEQENGTEKPQAVVAFKETKREWALNKTNAQCLVAMWGPDSDDWIGKRVTLYPERDASGLSDSGLCIRVKGSPLLDKAITASIKLPRRRPVDRKLVPTGDTPATKGDAFDAAEEDDRMHAVCSNCGDDTILAPDVTPEDLEQMTCGQCGQTGTYTIAHHDAHDPGDVR